MSCLELHVALEFVSGDSPPDTAREVESHMARCAPCRRLIAELVRDSDTEPGDDFVAARSTLPQRPPRAAADTERDVRASGELSPGPMRRGDRIGRYQVLYRIGEGGMGAVYAAFDERLHRNVALKFLRTDIGPPQAAHRDRLLREARALARLSHPNVVGIYDVAEHGESVYLAMEFVEGTNARIWQELSRPSARSIIDVYLSALAGLAAAHKRGIVHRDFKPDNVVVGVDGTAQVTDFGLARGLDAAVEVVSSRAAPLSRVTQTGHAAGTPRYMAPEQLTGTADARSDQFSFCVALYEAIFGHYPFGTRMPDGLDRRRPITEQVLTPLRRDHEALRRVLLRGMSPNPDQRWPSMRALEDQIRAIHRPRFMRRGTALIGASALIAAVASVAALVATPNGPKPLDPALEAKMIELEEARREILRLRADLSRTEKDADWRRQRQIELAAVRRKAAELTLLLDDYDEPRARVQLALPRRVVERSIQIRVADLLACYERSIVGDETLEVSAELGIDQSGHITWTIAPYQGDRRSSACLDSALRRVRFPTSRSETAVSLRIEFYRLDTGLLAADMAAETRAMSPVPTTDRHGRIRANCSPNDPLCGLKSRLD